ncbi:MAG: hypothetical protein ACI96M_003622 [Candidatus Azotimanducaceae bacterium]|jgi:hypothetical protein
MKLTASTPMTRTAASLMVALAILFIFVTPAEFDFDPLGTGTLLGIKGLSTADEVRSVNISDQTHTSHTSVFYLSPFESIEVKYRLSKGDGLVFSWHSNAEVLYDLHAEPKGAAKGVAESFDQGRTLRRAGTYIAAFDGLHGWFFENRGNENLEVNIRVSGFFREGAVYRGGYPDRFVISEPELTSKLTE